ncbi:MAG: pentapeptide repeat-containing protein [Synechococcales cyanobacterium K44_A2020_017]|nr:pentapeptide repeat-containing protein [Synechococcales cyanobacterium K32_A2020_035]MBF2095205.1 pentapeptide repeat-containing protein [Synechococcales cyanobacterium K44_A2020_017]
MARSHLEQAQFQGANLQQATLTAADLRRLGGFTGA